MQDFKLLGMALLMAGLMSNAGLAGTNAPATADDQVRPAERNGPGRGLAAELGISGDKANEIKNIMHETQKNMIKLKSDRDLAKADLEHLLTVDTLDEKAIMAAADKLAQVNAEMTKAQVKARLAVSAALTPEQRERLHELRKGMLQRFQERGGERRNQWRERRGRDNGQSGDEPGQEDGP